MITLSVPSNVMTVIGGTDTASYDKLVLEQINYDTSGLSINGKVTITSTAQPNMQAISGRLRIETVYSRLTIEVQQLGFYRQITLTDPQNNAVRGFIRNAQDALESGLISVGVIDGSQSTGS